MATESRGGAHSPPAPYFDTDRLPHVANDGTDDGIDDDLFCPACAYRLDIHEDDACPADELLVRRLQVADR